MIINIRHLNLLIFLRILDNLLLCSLLLFEFENFISQLHELETSFIQLGGILLLLLQKSCQLSFGIFWIFNFHWDLVGMGHQIFVTIFSPFFDFPKTIIVFIERILIYSFGFFWIWLKIKYRGVGQTKCLFLRFHRVHLRVRQLWVGIIKILQYRALMQIFVIILLLFFHLVEFLPIKSLLKVILINNESIVNTVVAIRSQKLVIILFNVSTG